MQTIIVVVFLNDKALAFNNDYIDSCLRSLNTWEKNTLRVCQLAAFVVEHGAK